jgi:hypothetical protein
MIKKKKEEGKRTPGKLYLKTAQAEAQTDRNAARKLFILFQKNGIKPA